ncbi:type IV secretion system DNA-binding domain-containing protein [Candidatus Kaiserbacteria bacterium]|nr:type IV secretion system DNA-binding domain-containing protein [Candidatus Kaiserbacteria bacterium]
MVYDPEQITFFAKTDARGQNIPFGIKAKDRTRHVYVIGKTGMGKSTLLENMAVQDIKNGNGLAFIDPHGQTAETLLNYIPEERKKDVLYFAPFDADNPVSFNVMEDVGADRRHLVVSGLMSVFKKIWIDAWSARMEYILSNTLLALLEYPDSTLLGVNRMLSDKDYRKKVIENIKDPSVKSFWVDEFLKYNERYMQEAGDAIKNKIGQFTNNPLIRNIVGQPHSSFDIRKIMDDRKILIMNLSKGLVGESNANLLGSMLTTRIYLAAMSRADLNQEQMKEAPNFYFYVDEFQSFANATFADILSEARKYKLNLTIAHQYIEQMEEEVRNAVFGNVGTIISFRVGPFDAEVLETIYTPRFLAPDIVNLGFAQIYLTLMIDGIGSAPFSATTLPPIPQADVSCRDIIIAESRKQFSRPRTEVEEMVLEFHKPVPKPEKEDRRESKEATAKSSGLRGEGRQTPDRKSADSKNDGDLKRSTAQSGLRDNKGRSEMGSGRDDNRPIKSESSVGSRNKEKDGPYNNTSKKEASVEDLRAILKSIVKSNEIKTDNQSDTKDEKPTDKEGNKEDSSSAKTASETKSENGGGLREALAKALETVPETENSVKDEAVSRQTEVSQAVSAENKSVPPEINKTRSDQDNLNPKKLEQMMRVTGNDRPPLN